MLRGSAIWLLIMVAESVHGIVRKLLLEPVAGDMRARQISVFTGMLLIFLITLFFVRWMKLKTVPQLLVVGLIWVAATIAFEFLLGAFVMGYDIERIAEDFDPRKGGLMAFGLLFMFFAPIIAARIRRSGPFDRAAMVV